MKQITCQHCGDSYPDFDVAHVCSKGPYAPNFKLKVASVPDNVKKMWDDPRFEILADVDKLLNGSRIWGGMDWTYNPIHPFKYRPVAEKIRKALDDLKKEYGVEE